MAPSAMIEAPELTLAEASGADHETPLTLREARKRFERAWIRAALERHNGRMADTARSLGIQRTNLYRKLRQLEVARAGARPLAE